MLRVTNAKIYFDILANELARSLSGRFLDRLSNRRTSDLFEGSEVDGCWQEVKGSSASAGSLETAATKDKCLLQFSVPGTAYLLGSMLTSVM